MSYDYNAIVERWVDGDTVDLQVDVGFSIFIKHRFRLLNVDTPEIYGVSHDSDEYKEGVEALEFVRQKAPEGDEVVISTQKDFQGVYGRYLCDLYVNYGDASPISELLKESGLGKEE